LRKKIRINFGNRQIDFAGNSTVQLYSPQGEQQLFSLIFLNAYTPLPCQLEQAPCSITLGIPPNNGSIIATKLERAGPQNFVKLTLPGAVQI
jgi:hypothetical protein